jgi:hypothetical protein
LNRPRLLGISFMMASAIASAGCSQVTYGTGTGTTRQTITDVLGIMRLGTDGECVLYHERPPLVIPPPDAVYNLPPPGPVQDPSLCPNREQPAEN